MKRRSHAICIAASLVLASFVSWSGAPVHADEILLQSGKRHRGYARIQGAEVHLNAYGCSVPEMTLGVQRFRRIDVHAIRPEPLVDDLHRRLEELAPSDVGRRLELMRIADAARLVPEAKRLASEILRVRSDHAEALKVVGGAEKWAARRRGDPRLLSDLALSVRRLIRLESGEERRIEAERLTGVFGYVADADRIERMVRSLHQERGVRTDVQLRLEADAFPKATYSLFVPADYDPLVPRPLMLALHGGGIMHQKGEAVRGSARDAMAHYLDGARERGWILCCPTAVEAPWDTAVNLAFLRAVLAEVTSLWNVDLERMHLAGQGGGGDGVWYFARREARRFASVSVAAAGKPSGVSAIAGKTALWLFHGEADDVVPVEPVRKAAEGLLARKAEFVYCQLPKEGHGLPPAAKRDLFRYIGPKRRRKAKSAWPSPSFAVRSNKVVIEALGDPAAAWGLGLPADATVDELWAVVRAGRTDAEPAARRLEQAHPDARARLVDPLCELLADRTAPRAARVQAARLLGVWRIGQGVEALGNVLRTEEDALLLRHAATAVGAIASPDSVMDLRWALTDVSRRYRALKGKTVAYADFEQACRLGAAVADAIGRVAQGDDAFFGELEENLVRHVLMDRRAVLAVAAHGEDPSGPRTRLAVALVRTYQRLGAEKTLFDMLWASVRRDPRAAVEVRKAMRTRPQ